jgi:GGDEF domain-containing protein
MNRMRFMVIILITWLLFLFSIERLIEPINISRVAYPFAPLMAVLVIVVPILRKAPLWALLLVPIPIFLALKALAGYEVLGTAFPLTMTELCIISVTTILAHWVSNGLGEFEKAVARITIGPAVDLPESFATDQAEMYREVKRARHYQRPLSMMAIGIEDGSIQVALDRMVQEAQQSMMKRYVLSDVARVLCDELDDYNIIAQANGHFLVLLPEIQPRDLDELTKRLHSAVSERVGVILRVGTASFPRDAVTFESLVDEATKEIKKEAKSEVSSWSGRAIMEHQTT